VPATCDLLGIRRHRHSHDNSSDDDMDLMITKLIIKLLESHYHSSGEIIFGLPKYTILTIGTVLVGFAQPFFQCTPPLLSAVWFASNERATSSAVALNFNLGIAAALIVGGYIVNESTYSSSTHNFDYTNDNNGNYSSSIIIDNRSDYNRICPSVSEGLR
jgi:hypothetical protein